MFMALLGPTTAWLLRDALWRWVRTRNWSVLACVASLVLGFVSLGLLGGLLYYPVAPMLLLCLPPFEAWTGDWVWPAMLEVSFLWPLGFLIAGELDGLSFPKTAPPEPVAFDQRCQPGHAPP